MSPSPSHRRRLLWAATLPILLLAVHLRVQLSATETARSLETTGGSSREVDRSCQFPTAPGGVRRRLVVAIVDSLRDQTALDPRMMPWLVQHQSHATWGRMQPCLAQLSLICFRTMFEGSEPLLTAGLNNFGGMTIDGPGLIHRLGGRGLRIAAVADLAFIRLYRSSLAIAATFEDRPPEVGGRDDYAHQKTFEWLSDPSLDVIITHTIDTDAVAHRVGVDDAHYAAKFRDTDDFLRRLAARLGPDDSLLILGDHGHDERGYHSTGIPSTTAYFASGALFPPGKRLDLTMASAYALMGAVTCEPSPPGYSGDLGPDTFTRGVGAGGTPEPTMVAASVSAAPPPRPARYGILAADLPAVLTLLSLVSLLARALSPERASAGGAAESTLVLLPAIAMPHAVALWGAAALAVPRARFRWFLERWQRWAMGALLVATLALGYGARLLLVTLQSEVNPLWSIGFWTALAGLTLVAALPLRRMARIGYGPATGLAAWGIMFFALYLGPYYYGSARNLLFGLTWLLVAHAWGEVRRLRGLGRWVGLALVPMIPLHLPVLKEWQSRYVLLGFSAQLDAAAFIALCAAVLAVAVAVSPERAIWRRALPLAAGMVTIGLATDTNRPAVLGALLLTISYVGFNESAKALALAAGPRTATARYLQPIAQASYPFFLLFLLLGSLRFANVDFSFALRFAPVGDGEGAAAITVLPFVMAKYLLPLALLVAVGARLDGRSLLLLLIKGAAMVLCLFGMNLAADRATALFAILQTQEIALYALLYLSVLAALFLKLGRPPVLTPASPSSRLVGRWSKDK